MFVKMAMHMFVQLTLWVCRVSDILAGARDAFRDRLNHKPKGQKK